MDEFKIIMHTKVGIGGMKCPCCNDYHGRTKKDLSRIARHILNRTDRRNIDRMKTEDYYAD